jgi:hypothetical protein
MTIQITNPTFSDSINLICELVGYPKSADPAGSTDPKHGQMRAAVLNALGELLALHEWQDLTLDGSISVVADMAGQKEKAFDLPLDFYRFIDQTQWSQQQMWPAGGPVSPQGWKQYVVWGTRPEMALFWQTREDKVWFLSPPFPNPQVFTFFYLSRAQVIDETDPALFKNVPTKNGDKYKLDGYLITLLARKKWLEWNSMDSVAATNDFNIAFNSRVGADRGASVLSLVRRNPIPLVSACNVPQTGVGL